MKTSLPVLIIFLVVSQAYGQTYLSAGPAYSTIDGATNQSLMKSIGAFAGLGQTSETKGWVVNSEIQFLYQTFQADGLQANAMSGNIMVYGGPRLFKSPVALYVGGQMGFTLASEMKVHDQTVSEKGPRFSVIGAIGYKIDRYEIISKYYRTVDGKDPMDYTIQLGVNYRLRGN